MNVFVMDSNPKIAARLLWELDKVRARKQVVEMCQMLACLTNLNIPKKDGSFYKKPKSIYNHPATIWLRSDLKHITWCIDYLEELVFVTQTQGCLNALKVFKQIRPDLIPVNVRFSWITKKTTQPFSCLFESTKWYIQQKQLGLFKN